MQGLPYHSAVHTDSTLSTQVRETQLPEGVFVGHFFGLRHGWASHERMSFHTVDAIKRLSAGLEILMLLEVKSPMVIDSEPVNWHRIDVIMRKIHLSKTPPLLWSRIRTIVVLLALSP